MFPCKKNWAKNTIDENYSKYCSECSAVLSVLLQKNTFYRCVPPLKTERYNKETEQTSFLFYVKAFKILNANYSLLKETTIIIAKFSSITLESLLHKRYDLHTV